MSTGKTSNIQLNQWEPQDNFLREEFNEDNRRIDAEFVKLREERRDVLLMDVVTQHDVAQVDLNLADVDFTKFWKVKLFFECALPDQHVYLRVNGVAERYFNPRHDNNISQTSSYLSYFNYPGKWINGHHFVQPAAGLPVAAGVESYLYQSSMGAYQQTFGIAPINWEDLESFNFYCIAGNIPAGTRIVLRGVKR